MRLYRLRSCGDEDPKGSCSFRKFPLTTGYSESKKHLGMDTETFLKDLHPIMENGRSVGVSLPLPGVAQQMMTACASMGYGLEDVAAVLKVYEKLAGIER